MGLWIISFDDDYVGFSSYFGDQIHWGDLVTYKSIYLLSYLHWRCSPCVIINTEVALTSPLWKPGNKNSQIETFNTIAQWSQFVVDCFFGNLI